MPNQKRARNQRLLAWFALNLAVFVACYLNYRLQMKHRYLYRTLSVGLCLSRAAAMVINFNLLLVWLPMCKYTLTRLAVFAHRSVSGQRNKLAHLMGPPPPSLQPNEFTPNPMLANQGDQSRSSLIGRFAQKLKQSVGAAILRLSCHVCVIKIRLTNTFLVAVDHCTSLHTICATTITVASIIHTVAHLMNVINFSNKFDPLLGDLNMAEYKGQNPLQLLVSVPGITGCVMVVILFLMSLSSISIIRNSSYDLFQIFHRLSIIFVILLILHPSSHVLKEQSNLGRHHPDFCYDKMVQLFNEQSAFPAGGNNSTHAKLATSGESVEDSALRDSPAGVGAEMLQSTGFQSGEIASRGSDKWTDEMVANSTSLITPTENLNQSGVSVNINYNQTSATINDLKNERRKREIGGQSNPMAASDDGEFSNEHQMVGEFVPVDKLCLDPKPVFVAQSSICWYVLSAGLSCYLLDLLLRRLRRSRSSIELLDACTDAEGNLIELVLSNNHKRFVHWLPGQFVYLNCPQIATYEWHPFTISSMDNDTRQFTLHIKAGGDWTRKLRYELELRQQCQRQRLQLPSRNHLEDREKSMSLFYRQNLEGALQSHCCVPDTFAPTISKFKTNSGFQQNFQSSSPTSLRYAGRPDYSRIVNVVANLEDYDHKTGQLHVECKRLVRHPHQDNAYVGSVVAASQKDEEAKKYANDCIKIDLDNTQCDQKLYSSWSSSLSVQPQASKPRCASRQETSSLDLFIDGPFHSPFERLLEQQVSICIANGVGWTAFSSIFQQITNNLVCEQASSDAWWSRWHNFRPTRRPASLPSGTRNTSEIITGFVTETKLHLMVIVTTIEQFKPFYNIVRKYYQRIQEGAGRNGEVNFQNPIKEVTVFITRSTKRDSDVVDFCRKENLSLADPQVQGLGEDNESDMLRINKTLTVRFGRPDFGEFLSSFNNLYSNEKKISVYCCGSYQVKRVVEEICKNLNRNKQVKGSYPLYQYHEENF